ncbi:MAG TPA: hypothetical protein VNN07_07335 [Candidatus Tectomicrobia bacterium]|nr:hypothetical protein [Candidatus Tectomicrobia bacterium]
MATSPDPRSAEPTMDAASLYREDVFTDRRAGAIRQLTPVTPSGAPDATRATLFVGEVQLLTSVGALPLSFEIDAASLEQAVARYAAAAKEAVERAVQELQELRRQAASSIIVPERGMSGLGGPGGLPPGGLPGGRIKLP